MPVVTEPRTRTSHVMRAVYTDETKRAREGAGELWREAGAVSREVAVVHMANSDSRSSSTTAVVGAPASDAVEVDQPVAAEHWHQ